VFGIFAAYAFARMKFKGSNILFVALIFAQMLPPVALLIPFYYAVRKHVGSLPWLGLFWRPLLASSIMAAVMWLLRGIPWPLLTLVGAVVYLVALVLAGGFRQPDMDLLHGLVPLDRLRARLPWAKTTD
jgi:hypothetical protein